jgi:hypothetical protein
MDTRESKFSLVVCEKSRSRVSLIKWNTHQVTCLENAAPAFRKGKDSISVSLQKSTEVVATLHHVLIGITPTSRRSWVSKDIHGSGGTRERADRS